MKISDFVPNILGGDTDDAVSLLTADHDKVKELFKKFEEIKDVSDSGGVKERQRIVAEACRELTIHTTIEDEIFYPAVRAAIEDDDLMNEATVEHDGAKALIEQLEKMSASDEMFNAKFTVLSEYVNHHIKEEQSEMFPKARKSAIDLDALGHQMLTRKKELMNGARSAHKSAPKVAAPKSARKVPSKNATQTKKGGVPPVKSNGRLHATAKQ